MPLPAESDVTRQNPASQPSDNPASTCETPIPSPLVVKSDLVTTTALIGCAVLACLPDRARQTALCRSIARKHIGLRGSRAKTLQTIIPLLDHPIRAETLEIELLADEYEAVAETWRDYMPWSRKLTGTLSGQAPLDAALAAGRGAVLWTCTAGPASRVALRCLAEAGYPLVALRRYDQPYSESRFCRAFLNPIPNNRDNQYLESVVILHEDHEEDALQALGDHLAANKLVLVTADGAFGSPHDCPYFGGTLRLGLGAPSLAMRHNAPLIPLFCLADGKGGYDVIVDKPLVVGSESESSQAARQLADHYASVLAPYLKGHPRLWENWYAEDTWTPGDTPAPD